MSSRSLLIAGFVGGVLAALALFGGALVVVASAGSTPNGPLTAMLVLATVFGFVLDSIWLSVAVGRLTRLDGGSEGEEHGEGGGPKTAPPAPQPPPGDVDWWAEFEREFRAYADSRRRPRVAH